MTKELIVDIIKKENILPSSSTPQNLKSFNLSVVDQLSPAVYTPLILFYTTKNGHENIHEQYVRKLKTSLSEALLHFYPLAGRIKDNVFIDCNDEGVEFLEAQANFKISEILDCPDASRLKQFVPKEIECTEAATGCLLVVQATIFECGGLAIGISTSHKLVDATTLSTFMKCWTGKALCSSHLVLPELTAASIFPPTEISAPLQNLNFEVHKCITKGYVFSASEIANLKAKSTSPSVQNPTRFEAVSAFIWKCALKASRSNSKSLRPSAVGFAVNLRRRAIPPISEHCIGSLAALLQTKATEIKHLDLQSLVVQLRMGKDYFGKKYGERLRGGEASSAIHEMFREANSLVKRQDIELYIFSSWSNLGLYDADFGWGRPTGMSFSSSTCKNSVVLMDISDGKGIEAWVTLSEEDMAIFERDEELLEFVRQKQ